MRATLQSMQFGISKKTVLIPSHSHSHLIHCLFNPNGSRSTPGQTIPAPHGILTMLTWKIPLYPMAVWLGNCRKFRVSAVDVRSKGTGAVVKTVWSGKQYYRWYVRLGKSGNWRWNKITVKRIVAEAGHRDMSKRRYHVKRVFSELSGQRKLFIDAMPPGASIWSFSDRCWFSIRDFPRVFPLCARAIAFATWKPIPEPPVEGISGTISL